jgi:hypothetical protein
MECFQFWSLLGADQKDVGVGFGVFGVFLVIWEIAAASMGMEQAYQIIDVGSVVQCVIFGPYGKNWQQTRLESRGFVVKDTVTAANAKDAIELYMKNSSEN